MSTQYINEEEYRARLLERKAQIDAELANLSSPTGPSPSYTQHSRRQNPLQVRSRSYSHNGQPMTRKASSGRGHLEAIPMSTSVSQHSAPLMVSNGLQSFPSSGSPIRFTNSGPVTHPLQIIDSRREAPMMESWETGLDDPITAYNLQPPQAFRSPSQRKSDVEEVVAEIDSGELPIDYFTRTGVMSMLSNSHPPNEISTGNQWRSPSHRGSMSSRRRPSVSIAIPSTPSSGTLTSGSTFVSEMSRQNSLGNDAFLGSFEMMNVHSNTSIYTDSNSADEMFYQPSTSFPKYLSSEEEQSRLLVGAGGASADSKLPHSPQDLGDAMARLPSQCSLGGDMKRSRSNESSSSSSSVTSRATKQLKRQNQLASRKLAPAPKAESEEVASQREGSHPLVSIKSKDGSESRAVQPITKAPYQRPKHARVFCHQCNECPDGFRGQHELRRHNDRQHKVQVKKWVCVEPAEGLKPEYQPVQPLSACKSCLNQKKKYGAYYNAAAHLRRAHFRPKQRNVRKSGKVDEKRSGNGGGEWPPMDECKRWMKEVFENVPEDSEEEEEDVDDVDCNELYENDDSYTSVHDTSTMLSVNTDLDNAYVYADTPMLEAYPTPSPSLNSQSMQNIAYDNLNLPQSIDLTMHVDSSQASFADSQFASINEMAFIESFPQPFADQLLGSDSFPNFQYQM